MFLQSIKKSEIPDEFYKQCEIFNSDPKLIIDTAFSTPSPLESFEYLYCKINPIYYLKTYAKIQHPLKGIIPFNLYSYQEDLLKDFLLYRELVINKSRQMGITTLVCGYASWRMKFYDAQKILALSISQRESIGIVKKVKLLLEKDTTPDFFSDGKKKRKKFIKDTDKVIGLQNYSEIVSLPKGKDVGRSEATSLLILDEAAILDNPEDVWKAAKPSLSMGGQCVMLSTPKGILNFFHLTYVEATQKKSNFKPIELPYYLHPERDDNWKEEELKSWRGDIDGFNQEYCCKFLSNTNNFIPLEKLDILQKTTVINPLKEDANEMLYIWEDFNDDEYQNNLINYVIGVDTATGAGREYSSFQILKLYKHSGIIKQVAEFEGQVDHIDFTKYLVQTAQLYKFPVIIVETNGIGQSVLTNLEKIQYPYLYSETTKDGKVQGYESSYGQKAGIHLTEQARHNILASMKKRIMSDQIIIKSVRLITELQTFIVKNNKPQHAAKYYDDDIFALAHAIYAMETIGFIDYKTNILDTQNTEQQFLFNLTDSTPIFTENMEFKATKLFPHQNNQPKLLPDIFRERNKVMNEINIPINHSESVPSDNDIMDMYLMSLFKM